MTTPLKKFLYFCAAEAWINLILFIASLVIVLYLDLDKMPDSDMLHIKVAFIEVMVFWLAWIIADEEIEREEGK